MGGDISISGNNMLYVTINDKGHQLFFYGKRGGSGSGAYIVSFEIPQSLIEEIEKIQYHKHKEKHFLVVHKYQIRLSHQVLMDCPKNI